MSTLASPLLFWKITFHIGTLLQMAAPTWLCIYTSLHLIFRITEFCMYKMLHGFASQHFALEALKSGGSRVCVTEFCIFHYILYRQAQFLVSSIVCTKILASPCRATYITHYLSNHLIKQWKIFAAGGWQFFVTRTRIFSWFQSGLQSRNMRS